MVQGDKLRKFSFFFKFWATHLNKLDLSSSSMCGFILKQKGHNTWPQGYQERTESKLSGLQDNDPSNFKDLLKLL